MNNQELEEEVDHRGQLATELVRGLRTNNARSVAIRVTVDGTEHQLPVVTKGRSLEQKTALLKPKYRKPHCGVD